MNSKWRRHRKPILIILLILIAAQLSFCAYDWVVANVGERGVLRMKQSKSNP